MTVVILLQFSRRNYHSEIFVHVSKVVTIVTFHFRAQGFKHVLNSSSCFTRPSWIILLYMNFNVVYVHVVSYAIHSFMSKIITCIT
jgi:hypothetical protein